jgi:hypothetical protein
MNYKEEQAYWKEKSEPKLLDPKKYTEHDKKVVANLTVFYSRAKRRKKKASNPDLTKKRHSRK